MATYKIVGSYQIVDVDPTPDVAVHPATNSSYAFTFDTAEQLKQFVLTNAAAKLAAVTPLATREQTINDQVSS